ncbi:hypothetical protein P6144_06570 [Sphingomonas sp. HITSZ_GF]|uniref:BPSS1187 family protein n=1 Tax=Sphingomonas sp. HITSZ_GF TaxID=3037247 RepID=UPI00240D2ECC|nr:hypothetical protein [Sphingomonas sp. HITSZ_GF]MDG2533304.1 hypothetical protein [Sphingomonas sp. HITSZ_GF]
MHQVIPSEADPAIGAFDDPSVAIAPPGLPADAPLAIFLPGTNGIPGNGPLLRVVAQQGYRVLSLMYNDSPAVVGKCPRDPDPACSGDFREMRIQGTGKSKAVQNSAAESIDARLVSTLRKLDHDYPGEGWGRYLDGDAPRWGNILVSGLSQGAGMAAWIAKRHKVRRVVLFSSPWDSTGADSHPAPWLSEPSATPIARWQAAYNARENTANLIAPAYAALGLGKAQIHIFTLDLPQALQTRSPNPYHGIGIRDLRYAPQWRAMYGKGSSAAE